MKAIRERCLNEPKVESIAYKRSSSFMDLGDPETGKRIWNSNFSLDKKNASQNQLSASYEKRI